MGTIVILPILAASIFLSIPSIAMQGRHATNATTGLKEQKWGGHLEYRSLLDIQAKHS